VLEPRQHADDRHAGQLLDERRTGRQERRVAAELVEDEAADPRPLFFGEQGPGAVEVSEGAAAVDVGDKQDRRLGRARDAHVGQVELPQIDLGRAAGAFDHDQLELVEQRAQRLLDWGPKQLLARGPDAFASHLLIPDEATRRESPRPIAGGWRRTAHSWRIGVVFPERLTRLKT
jgi:hypothetical protein